MLESFMWGHQHNCFFIMYLRTKCKIAKLQYLYCHLEGTLHAGNVWFMTIFTGSICFQASHCIQCDRGRGVLQISFALDRTLVTFIVFHLLLRSSCCHTGKWVDLVVTFILYLLCLLWLYNGTHNVLLSLYSHSAVCHLWKFILVV